MKEIRRLPHEAEKEGAEETFTGIIAAVKLMVMKIGEAKEKREAQLMVEKAWKYPQTETAEIFVLGVITDVIAIALIPAWNFTSVGFLIYCVGINSLMALLISRRYLPSFIPVEPPENPS